MKLDQETYTKEEVEEIQSKAYRKGESDIKYVIIMILDGDIDKGKKSDYQKYHECFKFLSDRFKSDQWNFELTPSRNW